MKVREYSKQELSQLYYPLLSPTAARRRFHRLILYTPSLLRALRQQGYDPQSRKQYFTLNQVRAIFRILAPP